MKKSLQKRRIAESKEEHPQQNLSRVQFFSSASSFESSINNSQVHYGQIQIHQQTQLVFMSLQKQLKPILTLQSKQKLQNILNRAHILFHFTIPQQIQAEQNLNIETNQITFFCLQKVKELVQCFQAYKSDKISYRSFYEAFRKYQDVRSFKKTKTADLQTKKTQQIYFQSTEKVQINHLNFDFRAKTTQNKTKFITNSPQVKKININEGKPTVLNAASINEELYQTKIYNRQLIQKVFNLKKEIIELKSTSDKNLQNERRNFSERIEKIIKIKLFQKDNSYFQAQSHPSQSCQSQKRGSGRSQYRGSFQNGKYKESQLTVLMRELHQTNQNLTKEINENRKRLQTIIALQHQNEALKLENANLKLQIERSEHRATSRYLHFTTQNQTSEKQNPKDDAPKLIKKRNQILITEIQILKRQLQNERQFNNSKKMSQKYLYDAQMVKIKDQTNRKSQQILQLYLQLDEQKTKRSICEQKVKKSQQNIRRIKQKYEESQQKLHNVKAENMICVKDLYKTGESFYKSQELLANSREKSRFTQSEQILVVPTFKISPNLSDVMQGFVYFKCLQREFRYRYRRACLKEKQLLYKKDGLEVGVISKYVASAADKNRIAFTVFLTNYDGQRLNNISLSVMSSNSQNYARVQNTGMKYSLDSGNQVKINVEFQIKHFPLGCVVLCVQGLRDQIRLLLPASIIKFFHFEMVKLDRLQMERGSQRMLICSDKKVYKQFFMLVEYLLGSQIKDKASRRVSLRASNQLTGTVVSIWIQYNEKNDDILILYYKQQGSLDLADYLIKTMRFLVEKQTK